MELTSNVITIASGKGGVGKSVVAVNVAEALVRQGGRVALVDVDFGQSACPVLLNESPTATVLDTVSGSAATEEAIHETETGLTLVQGADRPSQGREEAALFAALDDVLEQLRMTHEYVLIDGPGGTGGAVRWALDRADLGVLVLVGEPTAVADAYRLTKMLWTTDPEYPLGMIVNYADDEADAESVAERFRTVTTRFMGQAPHMMGWIPYASAIRKSVSAQAPIVQSDGPIQEAFVTLAEALARGQYGLVSVPS